MHWTQDEEQRIAQGNQFFISARELFNKLTNRHHLKRLEMQILCYLIVSQAENTASDICKNLRINKTQVSKTLDALGKRGLVSAAPDESDRRFMHYLLTEDARVILAELISFWEDTQKVLFKGLSQKEIDDFYRVCRIVHRNMLELKNDMEKENKSND